MRSRSWVVVFLVIAIVPILFFRVYLSSNFENNTYAEIVKRQLNNDSIYGTALNQNTFSYKLEMIRQVKPEIIALGSSRVMQFRREDFNTSFINAGGAMNHLNEGYTFLQNMYEFHQPKYIILGLDFWWFNDSFNQPDLFPYHSNNGDDMNLTKVAKTILWMVKGKVKIDTLSNIVDNNSILNRYTNYDNLGFGAIRTSDGFRGDGSYFYAKKLFGIEPNLDQKFSNTFSRIYDGNKKFEYGNEISGSRLKIFLEIINLLERNKTRVLLVIPPVANVVSSEMKKYNYHYVGHFREIVSHQIYESYDYHDLSILTEDDCECLDGFHGGDIVYKRILNDIFNHNSGINEYIAIANVRYDINNFKGHALTLEDANKFQYKEVDFLKIGCEKK